MEHFYQLLLLVFVVCIHNSVNHKKWDACCYNIFKVVNIFFFSYLSELKLRMSKLAFELEQKDKEMQRCNEAIRAVCDNIRNKINEVIKGKQGQQ